MGSKNKRLKKPEKVIIDFDAPCPPTKKQLAFIKEIEYWTEVEFIGQTIEEASAYIDMNIEDYYEEKRRDELGEDDPFYGGGRDD